MIKKVEITRDLICGDPDRTFILLAGPCVLEGRKHALKLARRIKEIADGLGIPLVFKSSYDKANRSSIASYRGPGIDRGLEILAEIKENLGVPVISDVHSPEQAYKAGEVLDIIQVPAFLSRQTDLVVAAGETGKTVNVKKGQFLSPGDMDNVIKKIESTGNEKIMLTERGTCFGYNNLVVDMTSLPKMRALGYPVVFDATHSVQLPGGAGDRSGGEREYAPVLTRAAVAAGIDALFLEVHDNPPEAKSDSATMLPLERLEGVLREALVLDKALCGSAGKGR
ncbi:MAG: 3-deoxy-8-phosphooctulonate synthase [Halanaerobiaceae bacterium]